MQLPLACCRVRSRAKNSAVSPPDDLSATRADVGLHQAAADGAAHPCRRFDDGDRLTRACRRDGGRDAARRRGEHDDSRLGQIQGVLCARRRSATVGRHLDRKAVRAGRDVRIGDRTTVLADTALRDEDAVQLAHEPVGGPERRRNSEWHDPRSTRRRAPAP